MVDLVIGFTGQFGSGCTTVSDFFKTEPGFHFKHYSFSDIIKPAAKQRLGEDKYNQLKKHELRQVLQEQGNILRESDQAAIANILIDQIKSNDGGKDVVVDTFRNPAEIRAFRTGFKNFFLVALDAPLMERFKRLHSVYGDNLEQFKKDDLRDKGDDEPEHGQQTEICIYQADISINNHTYNESFKQWNKFFTKIQYYVDLMRQPAVRPPTYEELYMRQAYALSLKSRCTKRHVGAIIVSESALDDKAKIESKESSEDNEKELITSYILAAGFNDVPIGDNPCEERALKRDPQFCPKDDVEEKKLRDMKYCPSCGNKLSLPSEKLRDGFKCPNCKAKLPSDFIPGKLLDTCVAVHAEEAAILQAAKLGSTALRNATLYTTTFPCLLCAKSIINVGIKKVVYHVPYPMYDTVEMLNRCKVKLQKYEGVNAWAFDRMYRSILD